MIASLPMYDRPSTRGANERLWTLMRDALGYGPKSLSFSDNLWDLWRSPDLLFAQTCSLPYRMELHRTLEIVASSVHDLPCPDGMYFSVIVGRENAPPNLMSFNGKLAINSFDSQSGWAALPDNLRTAEPLVTGSHAASAEAVANGSADLTAIDAVTWGMLDFSTELQVLTQTPPTPALPFVTTRGNDVDAIRDALSHAVSVLDEADRKALNLVGIANISKDQYLQLPIPEMPCQSQ